jgi:hypothetical protein
MSLEAAKAAAMPGWQKAAMGMGRSLAKLPGAMIGGAKALYHTMTGFSGLGVGAFLPGAAKLLVPGLLLGAAGLGLAAKNLLGGPYNMTNAATGYTPGAYSPYTEGPMAFNTHRRSWMDSNADGQLLLALHNQRKG